LFADLTGELNINFFKQWVPIFEWLPSYQKADLRGDAIAGITVAMMLIPQAMSYALLAVGTIWLLFV
jgi:SulP family sulfate permease